MAVNNYPIPWLRTPNAHLVYVIFQPSFGVLCHHCLQLLPILLIVGLTLFSGSQEPPYTLAKDPKHTAELATGRADVMFFVKDVREFDTQYPPNTHKRLMLERQVGPQGLQPAGW